MLWLNNFQDTSLYHCSTNQGGKQYTNKGINQQEIKYDLLFFQIKSWDCVISVLRYTLLSPVLCESLAGIAPKYPIHHNAVRNQH